MHADVQANLDELGTRRRLFPTSDGNRRVALLAIYSFLGLNGLELDADEWLWPS